MPGVKSRRTAGTLLLICCIISTILNAINLVSIIENISRYGISSAIITYVLRILLILAGDLLTAIGIISWKAVLIRVGCGISIGFSAFSFIGYVTAPMMDNVLLNSLSSVLAMTISIMLILISIRSSRMGGLKFVPGILRTVLFAIVIITYVDNGTFTRYIDIIKAMFDGSLGGAYIGELVAFTTTLVMQVLAVIAMWLAGVGLIDSKQVKVKSL